MKTISEKTCIFYQPRRHFEPPLISRDQQSVAEEKCPATDHRGCSLDVRGVLASKKNPCYFCDVCRHFEASLGFFYSKVVNLVKFIILALFSTFVRGVLRSKHTLVTNLYQFLLKLIQLAYTLLLLPFLRYLTMV